MKKNSLKNKVWIYLLLFALTIIGGLWILQVLLLNSYYEWSKKSEIKTIASTVIESYDKDSYNDILDNLAFKQDVCIEVTDKDNISYSTDSASRGCFNSNNSNINKYKLNFMLSDEDEILYRVINPKFKNKTLIYGFKISDDVYGFISASLEPIGSTVSVLKSQLFFVTLIILIIAFLISYTISKKISDPILKITNTCKDMSSGNYNVKFNSDTDIEEINELEDTLNNAALELSKTENIRREILANISHDLKTPLTLIKANAEMVRDLTYNKKEKRDKNLNTIISEVDRLNLLVEDILDLSRMQAKALELNIENFDLDEVIRSIINKFNILIERENYKINYQGFKVNVCADKKKIEQAIYNLINNAINYTGEDKNIYVKLTDFNDCVKIEIIDTGKGIDNEDIKYIWDKYYKVDKKYKRVTYGTGLGLSIVKNIFIMHKFKYGVETCKNKGSKFYFYIKKSEIKKIEEIKK